MTLLLLILLQVSSIVGAGGFMGEAGAVDDGGVGGESPAATACSTFTPTVWADSGENTNIRTPLSVTAAATDSSGDGCVFANRLDLTSNVREALQ